MGTRAEAKQNRTSFLIACILALYLFYYSYRYILRMNSDLTSPTYGPTPFGFQFAKYAILAVLCVLLLFSVITKKIRPFPAVSYLIILLLFAQNVYAFVLIGSVDSMIAILCWLPALIVLLVDVRIGCGSVIKVIDFFLCFTIVYELLQIALYALVGRLPALAYPTGKLTDVRFGGAWDDPNGFSVLLCFLIPYSVYRFRGKKRVLVTVLLALFMLLTWSMTGLACFVGILVLWGILYLRRHPDTVVSKGMVIAFSVIFFAAIGIALYLVFGSDSFSYFLQTKLGSFQGHMAGWDVSSMSFGEFIGLTPNGMKPETSIIALINHGGVIHMLLFYAFGVAVLWNAYRNLCAVRRESKEFPLFAGILAYELAFLVASVNLPFVYSFSNFGIYAIFLTITFAKRREYASLAEKTIKPVPIPGKGESL